MAMLTTEGLAYLTEDQPGIGGELKQRPEDFVVEELPRDQPSGDGDFLYLYVEKVRRLTTDVVRLFSQHFSVPWDAIGYAGLKDKHAVTRQWFSIAGAREDQTEGFADDFIRILDVARHDHPLSRGRLAGNRFIIRVRGTPATSAVQAKRILDRLVRGGAPNFVGQQRFGYRDDMHIQGRALILGDYQACLDQLLGRPMDNEPPRNSEARAAYEAGEYKAALDMWSTVHRFERQALGPLSRGAGAADAVNGIDASHRTLMVSAFQSAVFNDVLNQRLIAGQLGTLLPGDVAMKHDAAGVFQVDDPAAEQPRADALEISPTGPMWGRNMIMARGEVGRREIDALLETGVTPEDLGDGPYVPPGTRRALRMLIREERVMGGGDEHGPYVQLDFELPRGSFATVVLREIMKTG